MSEPKAAELTLFVDTVAADVRTFLTTLDAVASGGAGDQAVALLLLDVAKVSVAGAQLGATTDVVLEGNAEPEVGPDLDVDGLRQGLADVLGPVDSYAEMFDPYSDEPPVPYALSDDLADVAGDLLHGLRHHDAGRPLEALWWWQFSYLNHWGNHAGAALRALQSAVAHSRLDTAPEPVVDDAEF